MKKTRRYIRPINHTFHRKGLLIWFISLLATSSVYSQWIPQISGTTKGLLDVHFFNRSVGWAVGVDGTILHTTDSGSQWMNQYSGDTISWIWGVYAISEDSCWAVGGNKLLLKTIDGGNHWERLTFNNVQFDTSWKPQGVFFINHLIGWVTGNYITDVADSSFILKTTDGGDSWVKQYLYRRCGATLLDVIDSNHAWVCCSQYLMRTTDGVTWERVQSIHYEDDFEDVDFITPDLGWVTVSHWDGFSDIYRSDDGGVTLVGPQREFPVSTSFIYTSFIDTAQGWLIGTNGFLGQIEILRTTDAGTSWMKQDSLSLTELLQRRIYFVDSAFGWIVGFNGAIYHTLSGGVTNVENDSKYNKPGILTISAQYNPRETTLSVDYTVPEANSVLLIIHDILGKEVLRMSLGRIPAGSHRFAIDLNNTSNGLIRRLSTGTFMITLHADNAAVTNRFIYFK